MAFHWGWEFSLCVTIFHEFSAFTVEGSCTLLWGPAASGMILSLCHLSLWLDLSYHFEIWLHHQDMFLPHCCCSRSFWVPTTLLCTTLVFGGLVHPAWLSAHRPRNFSFSKYCVGWSSAGKLSRKAGTEKIRTCQDHATHFVLFLGFSWLLMLIYFSLRLFHILRRHVQWWEDDSNNVQCV